MTDPRKPQLTERNVAVICLLLADGAAAASLGAWSLDTFPPGRAALAACAILFGVDLFLWVLRQRWASSLLYPLLIVFALITAWICLLAVVLPFGTPPEASLFPYHVALFTACSNVVLLFAVAFILVRRDLSTWTAGASSG